MPARVFISPDIEAVISLHPYLSDPDYRTASIRGQIDRQAATLYAAFLQEDMRATFQIRCWWPDASGLDQGALFRASFLLGDARLTVAREHGFADIETLDALGDIHPDPEFEAALDAALAGDLETLTTKLHASPSLATARSRYGHRATLLHYLGANGVETYRQVIPLNVVEVARVLIAHGAEPSAGADMYGGQQTAANLAGTSAHPWNAGVLKDLLAALSERKPA